MLLLYQETKSLNKNARKYVFNAELELTGIFENILKQCIKEKSIGLKNTEVKLVAQNIMVAGQMWAFRRWILSRDNTINSYIERQTALILNGIT
jgi:hypothetical protein